jgi:uncharacterized damage-inducible protein DinB
LIDPRRLVAHLRWADTRLLERMAAAGDPPPGLDLLAHLLAAEQVWLARLRGEETSHLEIWPHMDLPTCRASAEHVHHGLSELVREMEGGFSDRVITYRNSAGRAFTSRADDVLVHVAMHGAYHRGQIALRLREAGAEPVNTDFITYCRETAAPNPEDLQ